MSDPAKNIVVVCGPNASGKTRIGVALALALDGEVVSADSRQVYRGMDIGTGKDMAEYRGRDGGVRYHLIDIADPNEVYTLFHYQRDCFAAIRDVWSRGRLPVMVGGTGLYVEAVLKGYRIPNVPENAALRKALMGEAKEALDARLKSAAPQLYARTDRSSKKRIVRALEVAAYEGDVPRGVPDAPVLRPLTLGVRWPRDELYRRIDRRLELRLEQGLVEEVRRLLASGIDRERFSLFGLEYRHVARFLDGEVSLAEATDDLRADIRRFAKRQMTYFRGMPKRGTTIHWIDEARTDMALSIARRYAFLPRSLPRARPR
jgi:tRNA dimethylallyltransferase